MDWLVRARLESVCVQRDKVFEQLAKVRELRRNLGLFLSKAPTQVQVNVGCDFYLEGDIEQDALLLIDIGKDIYVEMQPQEALETAILRETCLENLGEFYTKRCHVSSLLVQILTHFDRIGELEGWLQVYFVEQ